MPETCPLCQNQDTQEFFRDVRDYFRCSVCELVFVPRGQFLELSEERSHYDLHQNSPDDDGYLRFLSRLVDPLNERLAKQSRGLDFGSGPGPTVSVMLNELGHEVANYDPYYAPNAEVFDSEYDFITSTEVVEHLHNPRRELDRLWSILKPNGHFGIMTKRVISQEAFSNWHYKTDPTHVCFFSETTFRWLADLWGARVEFPANDVVILEKLCS